MYRPLSIGLPRFAFTIVELMVVMAIVSLVAALLLPTVQAARELARQNHCRDNLRQCGVSLHSYESVHQHFPTSHTPRGYSQFVLLLPFMGEHSLFNRIDLHQDLTQVYSDLNNERVPLLICPSETQHGDSLGHTNYAGNCGNGYWGFGNNGFFFATRVDDFIHEKAVVRVRDIRDGLSHTIAMSEVLLGNIPNKSPFRGEVPFRNIANFDAFRDLCARALGNPLLRSSLGVAWAQGGVGDTGYTHTLTPLLPSCTTWPGGTQRAIFTPASAHTHGVHGLFGDGSVSFHTADVDSDIWFQMGSISGNLTSR